MSSKATLEVTREEAIRAVHANVDRAPDVILEETLDALLGDELVARFNVVSMGGETIRQVY